MDRKIKIEELNKKLIELQKRQDLFYREIQLLKQEIEKLRESSLAEGKSSSAKATEDKEEFQVADPKPVIKEVKQETKEPEKKEENEVHIEKESLDSIFARRAKEKEKPFQQTKKVADPVVVPEENKTKEVEAKKAELKKEETNMEVYIGKKLISRIGMIILAIGLAIGVKYSIENNLISQEMRIILSFLAGFALIGIGFALKKKYEGYSAILIGGGIAVSYFTTFFAYSLYSFIPQQPAFFIMLAFTVFSVYVAYIYNMEVIAVFGMVGAYAVPFLVGGDAKNYVGFFIYMTIINAGILLVTLKKYWPTLHYTSIVITWIIFLSWYLLEYTSADQTMAFVFLGIFFLMFYTSIIAYKLRHGKAFDGGDIALIVVNSFMFYIGGLFLLQKNINFETDLGIFSLINAIIHVGVGYIIKQFRETDKSLKVTANTLAIATLTLAILMPFSTNRVIILWIVEAAALFWIGRTRNLAYIEVISYVILSMATLGLFTAWNLNYGFNADSFTFIFNETFLTSLIVCAGIVFILIANRNKKYLTDDLQLRGNVEGLNVLLPIMAFLFFYLTMVFEISHYWSVENKLSSTPFEQAINLFAFSGLFSHFKVVSILTFSLLYLLILQIVNRIVYKNETFGLINFIAVMFLSLMYISIGNFNFAELRQFYFDSGIELVPVSESMYWFFKYGSLALLASVLYLNYGGKKARFMESTSRFNLYFMHGMVIFLFSQELINLNHMIGSENTDKLGLSIMWGLYAFALVIFGIRRRIKDLRIIAFSLFSLTLLKLFLYDIAHLDTLHKTVIFITLGVLLLIISFLYNKYKHIIMQDEE